MKIFNKTKTLALLIQDLLTIEDKRISLEGGIPQVQATMAETAVEAALGKKDSGFQAARKHLEEIRDEIFSLKAGEAGLMQAILEAYNAKTDKEIAEAENRFAECTNERVQATKLVLDSWAQLDSLQELTKIRQDHRVNPDFNEYYKDRKAFNLKNNASIKKPNSFAQERENLRSLRDALLAKKASPGDEIDKLISDARQTKNPLNQGE
jgi:uncharacterized protein YdcH (DUF465 family)